MKFDPLSFFSFIQRYFHKKSVPSFEKNDLNVSLFRNDAEFDWLYPEHIELMSHEHWTPLAIACKAAEFLAVPDAKVLDIGSGIGKFCLAAAYHFPKTFFYGVEQRLELHNYAEDAKEFTQLANVNFIHANVTQINFKEFDHFYFYNSFYENVDQENRIDDTIETSFSLYTYYTRYLLHALTEKPPGTRLVTYQSLEEEVPIGYKLADSYNVFLKMWIKE
ncbi:class I SAM-dependent methyltransferase [Mucilaginibacter sp. 14171R-50]|uniref:class I SAM-dependent methyltransferase n=1 Tax=Mucilaginibacter sp. 14171R-50 TaxID=2703789 RepID=UPI00138C7C16|nr:class I SAM-dependent methyltransferase [Mucilaginibacter sp. 14171R-50]QHS55940.1 class I SAM-dependent methyltransferase [Mucilaginibacter sp. 14171R-50]